MADRIRPLAALAVTAVLALGATACSGDEDTTEPPGEGREVVPGEEGPVE